MTWGHCRNGRLAVGLAVMPSPSPPPWCSELLQDLGCISRPEPEQLRALRLGCPGVLGACPGSCLQHQPPSPLA